jgi:uncharacterized protein with PQ loop repeat
MRQRPISVTVFGILNIGYALWKYVGLLMMGVMMRMNLPGNSALTAMKSDPTYRALTHFNIVVTVILGIILIASGIGLLLLRNWARVMAVIYSILDIIAVVAGGLIGHRVMAQTLTTTQFPGASPALIAGIAQISFVVGILIGLAYPVLLLIFMTRPKIIGAFHLPDGQVPH